MFDVMARVPWSFFSVIPVFYSSILVGVPELTTTPTREFFTRGTLHVVAGFVLKHNVAACAFLTLAPDREIVLMELDQIFLLLVRARVRSKFFASNSFVCIFGAEQAEY